MTSPIRCGDADALAEFNADVLRILRETAARGRYTTAICAAPTVLAAAGLYAILRLALRSPL